MIGDVEFRVLGPLEVVVDGRTVPIRSAKQRALLAVLLLHPRVGLSTERIVEELWPDDPPARATNAVQAHVSRLRRTLQPDRAAGQDLLVTTDAGYRIEGPAERIDAVRFEALLESGQAALAGGDPSAAAVVLREALALWRGPALADFPYEQFAQIEAARLEELRLRALEARLEADLALGRHAQLIPELEALTGRHPLREELWAKLMLAFYRSGRQADALRAYRRAQTVLGEELGIEPGTGLRALEEAILLQDRALELPATAGPPNNLPAEPTSFVGREGALAAVLDRLAEHRLVTLTGVGGCGKTRLAIEVASRAAARFTDGVWLVELAELTSPALVLRAVAGTVGLPERDEIPVDSALAEFLKRKRLLLVLDNCEHVIDAVARLAEQVLRAGDGLRVLATSREPLGVAGEAAWPVPSLEVPEEGADREAVSRSPAVRLFVDRARAARPDFRLTGQNVSAVVEICRRLDGLPLALELAAARIRALTPDDIVGRLHDQFRLLTGGSRTVVARHQTLQAAMDWSYGLLDEQERALLRRLAAFRGGFSLAATEAVCAGEQLPEPSVLSGLVGLVQKSLVQVEADRYRLLETVRQYGLQKLAESGESDEARRRHFEFYVALAETADGELRGGGQGDWLRRLALEHDNLRAALEWALDTEYGDGAARMIAALRLFWLYTGANREGRQYSERAGRLLDRAEPRHRIRMLVASAALNIFDNCKEVAIEQAERALHEAGHGDFPREEAEALRIRGALRQMSGAFDEARELIGGALRLADTLDDRWLAAAGLEQLAMVEAYEERFDDAEELLEKALAAKREMGDEMGAAHALAALGFVARLRGHDERAERYHREGLAITRRLGAVWLVPEFLIELAFLARRDQRLDEAEQLVTKGLALAREISSDFDVMWGLEAAAEIAAARGAFEQAARLFACVDQMRTVAHVRRPAYERQIEAVRAGLGEEAFEAAWQAGTAMSPAAALVEVLGDG